MKRILVILVMLVAINANAQWVQMSNGMGTDKSVTSFTTNGNFIFAGTQGNGIYLSSDNGSNWSATNNGLQSLFVTALAVNGSNVFAGTMTFNLEDCGVFLSTNNGVNWVPINNGISSFSAHCFVVSDNNIFAGTKRGIYLSTNNGINWTNVNNGITNPYTVTLAKSGAYIFNGTQSGYPNKIGQLFLSTNNGSYWSSGGLYGLDIFSIAFSGTNVFAGTVSYGTNSGGIFLSTNYGTNWNAVNNGIPYESRIVESIVTSGSNLFTGLNVGGAYLSSNNGTNWININQGFSNIPGICEFFIVNNYIYAGTYSQSVWRRPLSDFVGIQNISTETPSKYSLSQNYPNPFNSMCNVQFSMCNAGNVKLVVYDIQGREVQTLVNERLQPGTYETAFDGSLLNSGVYFYKLITNGFTETKKMILIK